MKLVSHPKFGKHALKKPTKPFTCKICKRIKQVKDQVRLVTFGRIHYYPVCVQCYPPHIRIPRDSSQRRIWI